MLREAYTVTRGVELTGTAWPDLAAATIMALLFPKSAAQIIRQARSELRRVAAMRSA